MTTPKYIKQIEQLIAKHYPGVVYAKLPRCNGKMVVMGQLLKIEKARGDGK